MGIEKLKEYWVAEYSRQQDCFHLDTLQRSIEANMRMFTGGRNNDYQILGIFETYEEGSKYIRKLRESKMEVLKNKIVRLEDQLYEHEDLEVFDE